VHAEQDHFFLEPNDSIFVEGMSEHEEALMLVLSDDFDALKEAAYTLSLAFL
jgi:hypothetical protein